MAKRKRNTLNVDRLLWLGAASPVLRPAAKPADGWNSIYNPSGGKGPGSKGSVDLDLIFGGFQSNMSNTRTKIFLNNTRIDPIVSQITISDGDTLAVFLYETTELLPAIANVLYAFGGTASSAGDVGFPVTHSFSYTPYIGGMEVESDSWTDQVQATSTSGMATLQETSVSEIPMAYGSMRPIYATWTATPISGEPTEINFTIEVFMNEFLERFQFVERPDLGFSRTVHADAYDNLPNPLATWIGMARYSIGPVGSEVTAPFKGTIDVFDTNNAGCAMHPNQPTGATSTYGGASYLLPSTVVYGRDNLNALVASAGFPTGSSASGISNRAGIGSSSPPYFQRLFPNATTWVGVVGSAAIISSDLEIITNTEDITNTIRGISLGFLGTSTANQTVFGCTGTDTDTSIFPNINFNAIIGPTSHKFELSPAGFMGAVNYLRQYVDPQTPEEATIPAPVLITMDGTIPLTDEQYARLTAGMGTVNTTLDYDDVLGDFLASNPDIAAAVGASNIKVFLDDPIIQASLGLDPNAFTVMPGSLTGSVQLNTEMSVKEIAQLGLTLYGGFTGLKTLLAAAGNVAALTSPLGIIAVVMAGIKVYKASTAINGVLNRDTDVYRIPEDMGVFIQKHPEFAPRVPSAPSIPRSIP